MTHTIIQRLSAAQLDILDEFAAKINGFDANFAVFDTAGMCILDLPAGRFESDMDQLAQYAALTCRQQSDDVQRFGTTTKSWPCA